MCGIAGYINKNKTIIISSNIVSSMLNDIKHRGPDDLGIHCENNYGAMGMRRLSIQDLSSKAHQPMYSKDLLVCIIFNGEIYNANKKKKELIDDGYNFESNSDTEVILNLYLKYNEDCLLHLEGMFTFAILDKRYDKTDPKLFLARDQIGIKPLYYSVKDNEFAFCSELTPIVKAKIVKSKLNPNSIRQLLNYGSIKQPDTIFIDICMLMPGFKLVYKNGTLQNIKYWDLKNGLSSFRSKPNNNINPVQAIEDSLRNSVREQLCGDVQIGAFLSGGIDSSLIAALLIQESTQKVNTYSVGFNSDSHIKSELSRAKTTAKHLGTNHNEIIVNEKYVLDNIETFIYSLDQPSIDGLNSYVISDYTANEVKVALSGTGGDELFAGYPWFRSMINFKPSLISNLFDYNILLKSPFAGQVEKLKNKKDFISYFSSLHQTYNTTEIKKLMEPQLPNLDFDLYNDFNGSDVLKDEISILNRTSGLVINNYLLNQLLRDIDVCSMAKSLEVRVPFLSLDVIYNALNIRDEFKLGEIDKSAPIGSYRRNGEKLILFEISKKYLPKDFDMIPKNGFTLPFDDWLNGPLRNLVDNSIDYLAINHTEYFDPKALLSLKKSYFKNKVPWYKVWILMVLGSWLRNIEEVKKNNLLIES
jgi:asparagine synthase (glutamine-hydrolysing)